MKKTIITTALVFVVSLCAALGGENKQAPLVAHEWGTFTSLQDEQGNAIGGINTDDEPVPAFVHRLGAYIVTPQRADLSNPGFPALGMSKIGGPAPTIPHCDPDVLVRLETPVIYFYPPAGWKTQTVDVHVAFPGGWLSEYYPDAFSKAPGYGPNATNPIGHLAKDAVGELSWSNLIVGSQGAGPDTTDKVWLSPRDVKAAQVTATSGESEKFLFYRGVGNVDASLRVARNTDSDLEVRDNECKQITNVKDAQIIHAAWLVDVRADGVCAFKSIGAVEPATGIRATMPGAFDAKEYSADNMANLRGEMHAALIKEGLFADEADALLNTWEVSYFKNPGLRFFYMCPRVQIDAALPLQISVPTRISRVMVGRIEIVTPEQRALLKEIASGSVQGLSGLGVVKKLNQDYSNLGRFRNALILDEQKNRPTAALNDFINRNSLGAYVTQPPLPNQAGIFGFALFAASAAMVAVRFCAKARRKLMC